MQTSCAMRREDVDTHPAVIAAKADDPVFQRRQRLADKPRRAGYPAFVAMTARCDT